MQARGVCRIKFQRGTNSPLKKNKKKKKSKNNLRENRMREKKVKEKRKQPKIASKLKTRTLGCGACTPNRLPIASFLFVFVSGPRRMGDGRGESRMFKAVKAWSIACDRKRNVRSRYLMIGRVSGASHPAACYPNVTLISNLKALLNSAAYFNLVNNCHPARC